MKTKIVVILSLALSAWVIAQTCEEFAAMFPSYPAAGFAERPPDVTIYAGDDYEIPFPEHYENFPEFDHPVGRQMPIWFHNGGSPDLTLPGVRCVIFSVWFSRTGQVSTYSYLTILERPKPVIPDLGIDYDRGTDEIVLTWDALPDQSYQLYSRSDAGGTLEAEYPELPEGLFEVRFPRDNAARVLYLKTRWEGTE